MIATFICSITSLIKNIKKFNHVFPEPRILYLKTYDRVIVCFLNEILLVLFLNCSPKTGDFKIIKTNVKKSRINKTAVNKRT